MRERQIMDVLYRRERATAAEVMKDLPGEPSDSTVRTQLRILEKEEAQLSKLLEADTLDRTASVAQIYKVVQARGEMEKTNSLMTFEMREVLTRAQWTQLQAQQPTAGPVYIRNDGLTVVAPGLRGGGARGARGQ